MPQNTTQPVLVSRVSSDGRTLISKSIFPGQFAQTGTDSASVGLRTMVANGMLSVPIEEQNWVKTGLDSSLVSAQLTHYFRYPTVLGLFYDGAYPRRVWQLGITRPLPASQFVGSTIQNNAFRQDPHYILRHDFTHYDAFGNLVQQHAIAGRPSSYLWGYADSQPIAEILNATSQQVAYTSFERGATGRWQYDSLGRRFVGTHFTGRQAYELDGTPASVVRSPSLAANDYELLVWAHGTGTPQLDGVVVLQHEVLATVPSGWRQHRFRLHAARVGDRLTLNSGTQRLWIDELRLAPVGALMHTYTYDPGVGRTSESDPAGRTTTYEYDALGRLLRARDEQGRVLSQQQYHYAR